MSLDLNFVEGTIEQKRKVGTTNPNSTHAQMLAALQNLPIGRAFRYENVKNTETGKTSRVDSQWRKALQALAQGGGTHSPSGELFSNLHFVTGTIGDQTVIELRVGAPKQGTPRKKKEAAAAAGA